MEKSLKLTITIDFGSTYTKVAAFDLNSERLISVAQSKTTIDTDITIGLNNSLALLSEKILPTSFTIERMLASSSAAGGLQMVAIGLTKTLTTQAAQEAILGAGAKLTGIYSFRLDANEISEIAGGAPDIILLAGGTDGGNEKNIIHNAKMLANSTINAPIIIAGNKNASQEVGSILKKGGKNFFSTQNIMPELDTLNIDPTQKIIRELFISRITHAKGLNRAHDLIGDIIMPTPSAVLKAATLLSRGTPEEPGIGDLMIVDIGGATTDIHSIGEGFPTDTATIRKGLPEPRDKRTVEGDLGIRFNAKTIMDQVGIDEIYTRMNELKPDSPPKTKIIDYISKISEKVEHLPTLEDESLIDICIAIKAVEIASRRHAGTIESIHSPTGVFKIQRGKDLSRFSAIIGTGGILANCKSPGKILEATRFSKKFPEKLLPIAPEFFIDTNYILHSIGLLESIAPIKALKIIKKNLLPK